MPVSHRHHRHALKHEAPAPREKEYEIIDPNFSPDALGGIGGMKSEWRAGKHYIKCSSQQARFLLDNGSIKEPTHEDKPPPPHTPPAPAKP